jgi:Zn-dependent peptidase ImmA (M78 family)
MSRAVIAVIAVNPRELLAWWEGRGGRRPASLREIAKKLGTSVATIRRRLQALRNARQVDDRARARALAARGGHRRGGRPGSPLEDTTLRAVWGEHLNITATARHLQVSRPRVRARLAELGLLRQAKQRRRPQAPGRSNHVD